MSNCEKDGAKNGKKLLLFQKQKNQKQKKRQKIDQISTVSSQKKKRKKLKSSSSFHHGAEFFLLEQRLVHEDIRADTRQRSRYVLLSARRAFSFFLFFSLSTEEDRRNHRQRI
jgi:hypothetical protein